MNRGCFLLFAGVKINGSVQCNRRVPLCDVNCDRNNILCHLNFVKIFGLLYDGPMTVDKGRCPPSIVLSNLGLNVRVMFCDWRSERLAAMMFRLKRGCMVIFHCCVGDTESHSSYCSCKHLIFVIFPNVSLLSNCVRRY